MAGRAAGILVLVGVVNLPVIHYSVSGGTPCTGSRRADAAGRYHDPAILAAALNTIAGYRTALYDAVADADAQPDFTDGKTPPWVSELILKEGHR